MLNTDLVVGIFVVLLLIVIAWRTETARFKRIEQRVLQKGSWVKIVNTSYEPLFYGQLVATRFADSRNFSMALRGLLLPEAFSADLVAGLNERFPGQKDAEGHFLVLAWTVGYLIVSELWDHDRITELTERLASMNEVSAPRIEIGSDDIGLIDATAWSEFDEEWKRDESRPSRLWSDRRILCLGRKAVRRE
jgi:hypothetical protein